MSTARKYVGWGLIAIGSLYPLTLLLLGAFGLLIWMYTDGVAELVTPHYIRATSWPLLWVVSGLLIFGGLHLKRRRSRV